MREQAPWYSYQRMMEGDRTTKVESLVLRFFPEPGDRFVVVKGGMAEIPLVAANLSRSTHSYSAGQLLYVYNVYWGMNERAMVVGRYRRKHRFVTGVCRIDLLENARPKLVADPAVVRSLTGAWIDGGIFLRLLELPGGFWHFSDYQRHVLAEHGGSPRAI